MKTKLPASMRSLATDHKSSPCGRDNELRMQLDKGEFCLARELILSSWITSLQDYFRQWKIHSEFYTASLMLCGSVNTNSLRFSTTKGFSNRVLQQGTNFLRWIFLWTRWNLTHASLWFFKIGTLFGKTQNNKNRTKDSYHSRIPGELLLEKKKKTETSKHASYF